MSPQQLTKPPEYAWLVASTHLLCIREAPVGQPLNMASATQLATPVRLAD